MSELRWYERLAWLSLIALGSAAALWIWATVLNLLR
jgi:hypothetical protein